MAVVDYEVLSYSHQELLRTTFALETWTVYTLLVEELRPLPLLNP